MQPIVVNEGHPPWLRWLALPAAILVIVMVALALDTESRESYIDRVGIERAQEAQFDDIDATRLYLTTEDGEVVEFSVGDQGDEALGRDADGEIRSLTLVEDEDGEYGGLVVNDDGTFTPYRLGEDVSGKTTISPDGSGGFTLDRSDGSRVDLGVNDDGLYARDERGNRLDLDRDADGRVDLGDGLTADESDAEIEFGDDEITSSPQGVGDGQSGGGGFGGTKIIIILVGVLAIAGAVWWFVAMKPKFRLQDAGPGVAGPAPIVVQTAQAGSSSASGWDAFEAYLLELLADPEPERAVRLAFAYAEQGMGGLRARETEQTPAEWSASVSDADAEIGQLLQPLTNSYSAIRFGDQSVTSAERDSAVAELRTLVYGVCK